MAMKPCVKCGATDRTPKGRCRPCKTACLRTWRAQHLTPADPAARARRNAAARARYNEVRSGDLVIAEFWTTRERDKKREYYADPAARARRNAARRTPEYRARANAAWRARVADPAVRDRRNAAWRARMADPAVRDIRNAARRRVDPDVRARRNALKRERRSRQKQQRLEFANAPA